jgi:hypothetical protein
MEDIRRKERETDRGDDKRRLRDVNDKDTSDKQVTASISDLAPLYAVFGQVLGVLNHQVIADQHRELEELKQMRQELKKMKITGANGTPVYAFGLVDEHGYPHAVPSAEAVEFYYVRMMEFPMKSVPITVIDKLEVWLGGINIGCVDDQSVFSFENNAGSVEFSCPIDLWFDVCGGRGSLPATVSLHDEQISDGFLQQFDGETITFGEVAVDLSYIRRFLSKVCKFPNEIDIHFAKQQYRLYGIAEEAVAEDFTPTPRGGYRLRQYRNVSDVTMAEFGRRLFWVRDGLQLLKSGLNAKETKLAGLLMAKLAGETQSTAHFIERVKNEIIEKVDTNEEKKEQPYVSKNVRRNPNKNTRSSF